MSASAICQEKENIVVCVSHMSWCNFFKSYMALYLISPEEAYFKDSLMPLYRRSGLGGGGDLYEEGSGSGSSGSGYGSAVYDQEWLNPGYAEPDAVPVGVIDSEDVPENPVISGYRPMDDDPVIRVPIKLQYFTDVPEPEPEPEAIKLVVDDVKTPINPFWRGHTRNPKPKVVSYSGTESGGDGYFPPYRRWDPSSSGGGAASLGTSEKPKIYTEWSEYGEGKGFVQELYRAEKSVKTSMIEGMPGIAGALVGYLPLGIMYAKAGGKNPEKVASSMDASLARLFLKGYWQFVGL